MVNETSSANTPRDAAKKTVNSGSFIMFVTVMLMVTIAALMPLPPNDFFPYVRIGEEIAATGSIPTTEFMTYTQFGKPVEYAYWLPSLIFMWIFKLGGVTLTTIVVMLCVAAFFVILWYCMHELDVSPLISGLLMLIIGLSAAGFLIARPQTLALPLFSSSLLILIKWQNKDNGLLWLLPLITMFWVNLHGSFIILFFLLVPSLIFGTGNRKKLLIVTLISLIATLLNYYGFGIWRNIFSVVENESNQLFSWEFHKPTNDGWQANIQFGTFLVIPILTTLIKPKIKILYWIWFVGLGWMAFSGIRYGIWYLAYVLVLLGLILDPYIKKHQGKRALFQNRKLNIIIGFFVFLIPIFCLPGIRETWWKDCPPTFSETTPVQAIEWIRQNPQLPGEIWCDFTSCTYMTYALPERKLFITNRMDDFPVEQYEDYLSILEAKYDWQTVIDSYKINLILFNYQELTDFSEAILSSPIWDNVYSDGQFVIYERSSSIDYE